MTTSVLLGLRELRRSRVPLAVVTLILALMTMVTVGNHVTPDSLAHTRDHFARTLRFSDLEVSFVAASAAELPSLAALRAIPGVAGVGRRFLQRGYLEHGPERRPLPVVVVYLERAAGGAEADPNALAVLEGAALRPGERADALIDRSLAVYQGVTLGEELVVNPYSFPARFRVRGVGLSPEYLVPTATPELLVPSRGSMGVIYAWRDQLDELFVEPLYNSLVFRYAPGADPEATRRRVVAALSGLELERVVPREANFGHRAVEESIRGPKVFVPILALIFALMAGAVAFVTLERILVRQRRELGALMALGYSGRRLFAGLLLLGAVPGLLGAMAGGAAAIFYARAFAANLSRMVGLPPPLMSYAPRWFLLGGGLSLAVGLLAAALPLRRLLRLTPTRAMRGGGEIVHRPLPRWLEALVARASTSARYALRNLVRRPRLSLSLVALIAVAVAVPSALLTTQSTWMVWSEGWMGKVPHDLTVTFKAGVEETAARALAREAGLAEVEPFVQGAGTLERPGRPSQEVRLRGLTVPLRLERLALRAGRLFSAPDAAEVILDVRPDDPVRVGDRVTLRVKGRPHELTVVGLASDLALGTAEVPIETGRRLLDLRGKASGLFAREGAAPLAAAPAPLPSRPRPPGSEPIELDDPDDPLAAAASAGARPLLDPRAVLLRQEIVSAVQPWGELKATMQAYLAEYRATATPLIGLSAVMAFLSVLGMLGILLLSRDAEYATLRALGSGTGELGRIVAVELGAFSLAGLLLALPLWWGLSELLCAIMSRTWFPIPSAYLLTDLASVVVPVTAFLVLTWALTLRLIVRLDLSRTLAARAMG